MPWVRKATQDVSSRTMAMEAMGAGLPMVRFDLAANLCDATAEFCAMVGQSLDDVIGRTFADLIVTRGSDAATAIWQALCANDSRDVRIGWRTATGQEVGLDASFAPVRDEKGALTGVIGIARTLRDAEEVSRPATMKLNALSSSMAMIEFKLDGTIVSANDNFLEGMGYQKSELIGQHHAIFMPDDTSRTPEYSRFWEDLRNGQFKAGEILRVRKNGEKIWLQATYTPMKNSAGETVGILKIARDITKDKLKSNEDAGQLAALDRVQAVIEFDTNGTVLHANENFLSLLEYELHEVVGRHHSIFVRDSDTDEYRRFWKELAEGTYKEAQYPRMTKSGKEVWIQATYNPILDGTGKPCKVVKFATNVTPRRKAIEEFQSAVSALREGDLTFSLTQPMPDDLEALRVNFNSAIEQMAQLVTVIVGGTHEITRETDVLDSAANELSRRTEAQAATLEESAAAITEIAHSVESSSVMVRDASAKVSMARERTNDSRKVVGQTTQAMQDIAVASDKISKITGVIDAISFQTNLLALNAGVEAARAGDAGRGFAVVASEVRALAVKSSGAASDIAELLSNSSNMVKEGVQLVSKSGVVLDEINDLVDDIHRLVEDLTTSSGDQSKTISEISATVNQLDVLTQQNVSMFEETAASISTLRAQAKGLAKESSIFKVDDSEDYAPRMVG